MRLLALALLPTFLTTLLGPASASARIVREKEGVSSIHERYSLFVRIEDAEDLLPKDRPARSRPRPIPGEAFTRAENVLKAHEKLARHLVEHYMSEQSLYRSARARIITGPEAFATISLGGSFPLGERARTHAVMTRPELRLHLRRRDVAKWDWLPGKIGVELVSSLVLAKDSLKTELQETWGDEIDGRGVERLLQPATWAFDSIPLIVGIWSVESLRPGRAEEARKLLLELRTVNDRPPGDAWLTYVADKENSEAESGLQWLALLTPDRLWMKQYPRLKKAADAISKRGRGTWIDGALWSLNHSGLIK